MQQSGLSDDDVLVDDGDEQRVDRVPWTRPALTTTTGRTLGAWKVLVVDDDPSVRAVSTLALRGIVVDGTPIELVSVDSAVAARAYLEVHRDVAVALVDVVMESDTAGLELVRWVRAELADAGIRLILRTGQPGSAPEELVVQHQDIHDYLSKAETTSRRLVSCVAGAIRAWRDMQTIRIQRTGMKTLARAVERLFETNELRGLLQLVLADVVRIASSGGADVVIAGHLASEAVEGSSDAPAPRGDPVVHAGSGAAAARVGLTLASAVPHEVLSALEELGHGKLHRVHGHVVYRFDVNLPTTLILAVQDRALDAWAAELLELYCHAVDLALRHRQMWEGAVRDLALALSDREVLIKEIHHRVKNNLQIVASMLSLQAAKDLSAEARSAIVDSGLRVRSISVVHHLLYGSHDLTNLDLAGAFRDLSDLVLTTLDRSGHVTLELEPAEVPVDIAIPCCLVLNELLLNALKYGRSADGSCVVGLALRASSTGLSFTVKDNGPGLPDDFEQRTQHSLGYSIIRSLVRQLRATWTMESDAGARISITIPWSPGSRAVSPPKRQA